MTIKTFRGLLADDTQDTIVLHTNDGSTGYRIVKFEVMPYDPVGADQEAVLKIFTTPPTATTDKIDFSDQTLLAAAFLENSNSSSFLGGSIIIFDNITFNQDIYITNQAAQAVAVNYHIELEERTLDLSQSTVASLKNIRNVYSQITT